VRFVILLTAAVLVLALAGRAAEQSPAARPSPSAARQTALPPVLQTCPMHPDIVEDKPGACPLCRMALVPVRLESVWSCPLHAAVTRNAKGTCPICNRELVQMTMALTWTCRNRPDIDVIEPGGCPDGTPMIPKRTLRPHGNHNPQYGGQFFMAPDNTHHLEGALPTPRLFRLYLYDDFARPLSAARLKAVAGRVEVGGRVIPLATSSAGSYLQARIDPATFPARLTAKIRLKPDAPEYRFDFAFTSTTKAAAASVDPGTVASSQPRPANATRQSPTTSQESRITNPESDTAPDPALIQVPIPSTVPEIVSQLRVRDGQVRDLIQRGNLAAVFVPAFQARDLALALEARLGDLPASRRDAATAAIHELVRAAWLIDSFGDVGNAEHVRSAYVPFHDAALRIATTFGANR
jgi:hypothetical protein